MKVKNTKNYILYTENNIFDKIQEIVSIKDKRSLVVVPHVCNNVNVFGGGFTKFINDRYPVVQDNFQLLGKQATLGYVQFVTVDVNTKTNSKIVFANMIAQNGVISKNNSRPLNYAALVKCMIEVKKFIENENKIYDIDISEIHAPKFGSGLAGGKWVFISDLIEDIWHNITVHIHCI